MRGLTFASFVTALLPMVACAGTLSGEIDGDTVPAFTTSALAVVEGPGDAATLIAIWLTAGDACSLLAQDQEIRNDADTPEEMAEDLEDLYKERTPEQLWSAVVAVGSADTDDLEDTQEVEVDDPDEDLGAGFVVCERTGHPEEKDGVLDTDDDCFVASEGTLTLRYQDEDALTVGTDDELELDDEDGDSAGDVRFSGRAPYCKAWSEELEPAEPTTGDPPVE